MRRVALLAAVLAGLLAAGCSTGDDEGSATTSTPDTGASTSEPPAFTGDPQSPFCNLLRDVDTSTALSGALTDPATVETTFRELVRVLHDALAVAPPEIEADLALVSQGIDALDASLAQVGYDFDVLAASGEADTLREAVDDPAFAAAGARLSAYRTQVCRL